MQALHKIIAEMRGVGVKGVCDRLDTAAAELQAELDAARRQVETAMVTDTASRDAAEAAVKIAEAVALNAEARLQTAQTAEAAAEARLQTAQTAEAAAEARLQTAQTAEAAAEARLQTAQTAEAAAEARLQTAQTAEAAAEARLQTAQTAEARLQTGQTAEAAAKDAVKSAHEALLRFVRGEMPDPLPDAASVALDRTGTMSAPLTLLVQQYCHERISAARRDNALACRLGGLLSDIAFRFLDGGVEEGDDDFWKIMAGISAAQAMEFMAVHELVGAVPAALQHPHSLVRVARALCNLNRTDATVFAQLRMEQRNAAVRARRVADFCALSLQWAPKCNTPVKAIADAYCSRGLLPLPVNAWVHILNTGAYPVSLVNGAHVVQSYRLVVGPEEPTRAMTPRAREEFVRPVHPPTSALDGGPPDTTQTPGTPALQDAAAPVMCDVDMRVRRRQDPDATAGMGRTSPVAVASAESRAPPVANKGKRRVKAGDAEVNGDTTARKAGDAEADGDTTARKAGDAEADGDTTAPEDDVARKAGDVEANAAGRDKGTTRQDARLKRKHDNAGDAPDGTKRTCVNVVADVPAPLFPMLRYLLQECAGGLGAALSADDQQLEDDMWDMYKAYVSTDTLEKADLDVLATMEADLLSMDADIPTNYKVYYRGWFYQAALNVVYERAKDEFGSVSVFVKECFHTSESQVHKYRRAYAMMEEFPVLRRYPTSLIEVGSPFARYFKSRPSVLQLLHQCVEGEGDACAVAYARLVAMWGLK
jgi:hypothetical protein